jgi:hypothetical protein
MPKFDANGNCAACGQPVGTGGHEHTTRLTVPLEPEPIRRYLSTAIIHWRRVRDTAATEEGRLKAECYVDAFQSMHISLLGELVP